MQQMGGQAGQKYYFSVGCFAFEASLAVQVDLSSKPLDTWVSTELEIICSFSKYLLSSLLCALEGHF